MKLKTICYTFLFMGALFLVSCSSNEAEDYVPSTNLQERLLSGGETTVYITSSNAFSTPAANLFGSELAMHLDGDFQFESAFVTAPAEINGGIGPIFNNTSCVSCHPKDGRAPFPKNINALSGFFLRASLPGIATDGGPVPVPNFGLQIQNQANFGFDAEAKFQVTYTPIIETLADGTKITLQKPTYSLVDSYMSIPSNIMLSPRLAAPVFGLGLLEAITEADILMHEDINDDDGDGISGKANYVFDFVTSSTKIGRFGWKANTATVLEQCAGAYNGDMGITNHIFDKETGYGQTNGSDAYGDVLEVSEAILNEIAFYCKTLGVPAARDMDKPSVIRGSQLFEQMKCAKCHIPKMTSGYDAIAAVSNQTFFPYTDMLLHDMGDDLADNRPDYLANGNEWKTRPLWGIGLTQIVNGHTDFLHDGRAKTITEAILWHGGEALNSKNEFKKLSTKDRMDLLEFLNAI